MLWRGRIIDEYSGSMASMLSDQSNCNCVLLAFGAAMGRATDAVGYDMQNSKIQSSDARQWPQMCEIERRGERPLCALQLLECCRKKSPCPGVCAPHLAESAQIPLHLGSTCSKHCLPTHSGDHHLWLGPTGAKKLLNR